MSRHAYCRPIGKATLNGFHLAFRYHANIEPDGCVSGVLWEIDKDTLKSLDEQESYPGYYDRTVVTVMYGGEKYNAITYMMKDAEMHKSFNHSPSQEYLMYIVQGYTEFGIPMGQIKSALRDIEKCKHEDK
jgi:gamma-glutamylcyclotransferase (GGCT)/AIG2-like uncharacterized protein YtfP